MEKKYLILRTALTVVVFAGIGYASQAQKLKAVQEGNMRAPSNIHIDGKLTEWDGTFKAYNNTTDLFYTISNDDENLYFAIKAGNRFIANKLLGGGINFAINTTDQKKDRSAYTVVFPLIDPDSARVQMGLPKFFVSGTTVMFMGPPPSSPPTGFSNSPMDSAAIVTMRKRAAHASREIKLRNFPTAELADSVISAYNELGFKAVLGVDSKGGLALELAIPLKYLKLSTDDPEEFAYNIKLNGMTSTAPAPPPFDPGGPPPMAGGPPRGDAVRDGGGGPPGGNMGPPPMLPSPDDMRSMASSTDFWGKYKLAKK